MTMVTDTVLQTGSRESLFERADIRHQLDRVERRLLDEYVNVVDPDTVRRCVRDAEHALGHPRLHHFVPVLVERDARGRLRASAS